MANIDIAAHETMHTLTEIIDVPEHVQRKGESAEFRASVTRLKQDGHYRCLVCSATDDVQVHHVYLEWSLSPDADFVKLKQLCERWDTYGYGRLLSHLSITTVDDIRNCVCLCRTHHEEPVTGIHNTTMPAWVSQMTTRDDADCIPQDRHDIEKLLEKR